MRLAWLIPQEKKFFDRLEKYAGLTRECAGMLLELFTKFEQRENMYAEIKKIEGQGDDLFHSIVEELNATFVTPIDREDIHSLASQMDDILDFSEGAAERVMLFKLESPPGYLVELSDILYQATKELNYAMPILRDTRRWQELKKHHIEIHKLENRGDTVSRNALAKMFDTNSAVEIIKLKEISEFVEEAIDRCEDIAVVLENLVIKHA